ncbi:MULTISPECIES: hypothetical protein [Cellulomonas]|jgi:hypothetical protein|uniref:hypothetical protein n=1 Tax=Cellulomonas TaxID=1707 RepID=UPI001364A167|nr:MULTISPECIES: hypothetical protein [Cellulomonas]
MTRPAGAQLEYDDEDEPVVHWAVCHGCAWVGPDRLSPADARADAAEHDDRAHARHVSA